ncbi:MAG TPA: carbonic anhydrase [Paraburkholderia sp.]|uniref:carbonic anhydrase n=1 Tax=Paraburkholderia sp. TaxID=1926495 RepID=UPI002B8FE8CD|nr:carbonic anhydrase [Paraburkholderia sp.]HTR06121.1 carbonic anhydrase [Paraburkholderia sp.]
MDYIDTLMRRNVEFAENGFNPGLRMMPTSKTLIIGCVDPRVDPMDIFKLAPGEAGIFRNVGGRVNPALFETLGILRTVAVAAGGDIGPDWNLIVLHHTDCGIKRCYCHEPRRLAAYMGVTIDELASLEISDPYKAVVLDVATLRANNDASGDYTVSGLVYDVETGNVEIVVPPSRTRPDAG